MEVTSGGFSSDFERGYRAGYAEGQRAAYDSVIKTLVKAAPVNALDPDALLKERET